MNITNRRVVKVRSLLKFMKTDEMEAGTECVDIREICLFYFDVCHPDLLRRGYLTCTMHVMSLGFGTECVHQKGICFAFMYSGKTCSEGVVWRDPRLKWVWALEQSVCVRREYVCFSFMDSGNTCAERVIWLVPCMGWLGHYPSRKIRSCYWPQQVTKLTRTMSVV